MPEFEINPDAPLLIEVDVNAEMPGEELVNRGEDIERVIAQNSQAAINHALSTIHNMARGLRQTVASLNVAERPAEIEMQFGLSVSGEMGTAFLAKAGTEAMISVKLKWVKDDDRPE